MLSNILVPIDTSPLAEHAARKAAAIARSTGATLHLILVYESPFPAFDGGHALDAGFLAVDRAPYERQLRKIAAELTRRFACRCDFAMLAGTPAEAIAKYARDSGAGLIVMSTHGRTGVSRAWFGSVADAVAHDAPAPVLMVRAPEQGARASGSDSDPAFSRVLIALDGSDTAERVLETLDEARITGNAAERLAEIVLPIPLPIAGYPEAGLVVTMVPDLEATRGLQEEAEVYLRGVARRLERAGARNVETQACIAPNAGPAIVAIAREWNADLVAITSHGRGASRLVIGSVADKILRGTHASVLLSRRSG